MPSASARLFCSSGLQLILVKSPESPELMARRHHISCRCMDHMDWPCPCKPSSSSPLLQYETCCPAGSMQSAVYYFAAWSCSFGTQRLHQRGTVEWEDSALPVLQVCWLLWCMHVWDPQVGFCSAWQQQAILSAQCVCVCSAWVVKPRQTTT